MGQPWITHIIPHINWLDSRISEPSTVAGGVSFMDFDDLPVLWPGPKALADSLPCSIDVCLLREGTRTTRDSLVK